MADPYTIGQQVVARRSYDEPAWVGEVSRVTPSGQVTVVLEPREWMGPCGETRFTAKGDEIGGSALYRRYLRPVTSEDALWIGEQRRRREAMARLSQQTGGSGGLGWTKRLDTEQIETLVGWLEVTRG